MPQVLIGVGGSGQHVLHAYLRLAALANTNPQDVPHVYVIDADASIGTSSKDDSALCLDIKRLHSQLVRPLPPEQRAHFALIKPYFHADEDGRPGTARQNLELDASPAFLRDAFLTDDPPDGGHASANDRTVDLLQGMMANAKVGAMAFGFKLMRTEADARLEGVNFGYVDNEEKDANYNLLRDIKRARVAIIGSSFGGTGSGVIPALVRFLSSQTKSAPEAVRAFMTLPWFDIEQGGDSAAAVQADGIDPKARNAALGLRTYLDELDGGMPNANYVVSQFPAVGAKRRDQGNKGQGENPHVFNLILAGSVQNFLKSSGDNGGSGADGQKRKLFSLLTDKDEEARGQFSAERSAHLRFRVEKNDNRPLVDIAKDSEVLALALEKGAEYITPGPDQFKVKGSDTRVEPASLRDLCTTIAVSYDKKPLIKRGPFYKKEEAAPDEVYARLADALRAISFTIRQSLLWLDQHKATEDNPQGVIFPRTQHLFERAKGTEGKWAPVPSSEEALVARWPDYGLKVRSKQNKNQELGNSTPRIAQAFSIFMNCFASGKDYVQELRSLVQNQPDVPIYAVAARMLADNVFAEVIEARQSERQTEFSQDSADDKPPSDATSIFLRGLRADPVPQSSRLCVLTKSMLDVEAGDKSRENFQSPLDETHPLSLMHIDPYLGASGGKGDDLSSVANLASGKRAFVETGLKGIPNVLAPLLLQRWRLKRGEFVRSKQDALHQTPGVRNLRLGEYGLFQHGCRVVEAAFWLLFTQDPRVKLVDLPAEDALKTSAFARFVNAELRKYRGVAANNALPTKAIVFTGVEGSDAGRVIFINDPECGWFLAANHSARRFFGQILPELPSVKYGNQELDKAWRGGSGQRASTSPDKDSFEANMIAAFHGFLKKTVAKFKDANVLWKVALDQIISEIAPLVHSDSVPCKLTEGSSLKLLAGDGFAVDVGISVPDALANLNKLFVEKPVYFFVGDEAKNTHQWSGLWPISGSAWEHVVAPTDSRSPIVAKLERESDGQHDRSMWSINSITLNLKDLGVREFKNPLGTAPIPGSSEKMDSLPWAAALWPNFEAPGWDYYLAGGFWEIGSKPVLLEDFDLKGNALRVENIELRVYGETQGNDGETTYGEIGRIEKKLPAKIIGIPRAIEMVVGGRVMGSLPISLFKTPGDAQTSKCDIAIDFGTSNTCLAIKLHGELEPKHLPLLAGEKMLNGQVLPEFSLFLGPRKAPGEKESIGEKQFRQPRSPIFFFQSFNAKSGDGLSRSIPSELINLKSAGPDVAQFLESNSKAFEQLYKVHDDLLKRPGHMKQAVVTPHFTPFPPNPGGLEASTDLAEFLGSGLHRDFKWEAQGDVDGENQGVRAVYLEQLLIAACASLRWMGINDIKRVVATYPGAFGEGYRDKYQEHLGYIVNYAFKHAGLRLTQSHAPILKSETIAALAASEPGSSSVSVTIDMGGGTTDVGIIVPGASGQHAAFSYMASATYAGNDLLKALLKSPKLSELLGTINESDSSKLDRLKILIRSGSQKLSAPAVAQVAEAFFEGLFEYVFTLIAAVSREPSFPKDKAINVYLFGNGFRLTEVFLGQKASNFLDGVKRSIAACGMISPDVAKRIRYVSIEADSKLALIQGALMGAIDAKDGEDSDTTILLRNVEQSGHGRVALWYPCVTNGDNQYNEVTLGTAEERLRAVRNDVEFQKGLRLDPDNLEMLRKSFPITSKYWEGTKALNSIFNNAPKKRLVALGQYYLEGKEGVQSSFATVVLPVLAANARIVHSDDSRV